MSSQEPLIRKVSFFAQAARTMSALTMLRAVFEVRPIYREDGDDVPYTFDEYCASREPALIGYDVLDGINFEMEPNSSFKNPYFPDVQECLDIPSQVDTSNDVFALGEDETIDRVSYKPKRLKSSVDFLQLIKMNTVHVILDDYAQNGIEIEMLRPKDFDGDGLIVDLFDAIMFESIKRFKDDPVLKNQIDAVEMLLAEAAENRAAVLRGEDPVVLFLDHYTPSDEDDYTP